AKTKPSPATVARSAPKPQASVPVPETSAAAEEPSGEPQISSASGEPQISSAPGEPQISSAPGSAAARAPESAAAGATAQSPAPPLTVAQTAGVSPRRHLVWVLAAVGCLLAVGLLALWLRRRSRTDEGELALFGEVDREALEPESAGAAGEHSDVVKCKIIDGYLVLAPEGNGRALSDLPPESRREAKVRGSVELTVGAAVSEADEPKSTAPDGPEAQAKTLIGALSDESIAVRKAASQGLWELAESGRADVLLPYLKSEDPRIRLVVAGVLGEAGAANCAGALAEIASDPDPSVRASVLYAFAQLGERAKDQCDAVRSRLSDAEGSVRARALEALSAMKPKSEEVAGEALGLTGDGDPSVREAAVSAAFGFVSRGVTGAMIELLADPTRRSQAFELLQQGDEAALRRLLIAARNAPPESGERALETISYVMSRRWTVEDFAGELASSDPEDRLAAVEGLAMVGGDEAARELARLAKSDPSPRIKKRAAEIVRKWKELTPHAAGAPGGSDGGQSDS
ncbi:MAG: HEAT repeat domain-containing protein, partial [Armatimonadota bacterium]|nr:HEAT repeat domain-containing protein [Armatimonadota bacterium]